MPFAETLKNLADRHPLLLDNVFVHVHNMKADLFGEYMPDCRFSYSISTYYGMYIGWWICIKLYIER